MLKPLHALPPRARALALRDALFRRWAILLRDAPDGTHCTPVTGRYLGNHEASDAVRAQQLSRTVLMGMMPLDVWHAGEDAPDAQALCESALPEDDDA